MTMEGELTSQSENLMKITREQHTATLESITSLTAAHSYSLGQLPLIPPPRL